MRAFSGVFGTGLKLDMPLQADPTVQYALDKERRALTRTDLLVDHPFNTYRHPGLPPGPIASPGLQAIAAALDPAPVKYLYFVAMDDRRHYFSTTIEQHNAAVARYRLARNRCTCYKTRDMMRSTALHPPVLRPGARRPLPLPHRPFRAPVRRLLERALHPPLHPRADLPPSRTHL